MPVTLAMMIVHSVQRSTVMREMTTVQPTASLQVSLKDLVVPRCLAPTIMAGVNNAVKVPMMVSSVVHAIWALL